MSGVRLQVKAEHDSPVVPGLKPSEKRMFSFTLLLPVRDSTKRKLTDATTSETAEGQSLAHLSAMVDEKPKRQRIAHWLQDVKTDVKKEEGETRESSDLRAADALQHRLRSRPEETTTIWQNGDFGENPDGRSIRTKREETVDASSNDLVDAEQHGSRTQASAVDSVDEHGDTIFSTDMSIDDESCESELPSCSSVYQDIPEAEPASAHRRFRRDGKASSSTVWRPRRSKKTKNHQCDHAGCNKRFQWPSKLKEHIRTHTGEKPFTCSEPGCSMSFTHSSTLVIHTRTHTGEKPYTCSQLGCSKTFRRSGCLVLHMRTHTGEKPYICSRPDCGKSFAQNSQLAIHMRTHTGERPYSCPHHDCGKRFTESSVLVRHLRTHTGEKPYTCPRPDCSKSFASDRNLASHTWTHSREKPYPCPHPVCPKTFATSSHLARHRRRQH